MASLKKKKRNITSLTQANYHQTSERLFIIDLKHVKKLSSIKIACLHTVGSPPFGFPQVYRKSWLFESVCTIMFRNYPEAFSIWHSRSSLRLSSFLAYINHTLTGQGVRNKIWKKSALSYVVRVYTPIAYRWLKKNARTQKGLKIILKF